MSSTSSIYWKTAWGLALFLFLGVPVMAEKKVIHPKGVSGSASPLSPAVEADGLIYVSGAVGRDSKGNFAKGDIEAQTRQALENLRLTLKPAGLDLGDVVSTNLYLADIRNMEAVDNIFRQQFKSDFPARTTLEALPMNPAALVEIGAIAARDRSHHGITPEGWLPAPGPYGYAVQSGGTLFLSSMKPVDPKTGMLAGTTIQSHTEQALSNQEQLLRAAGMSFADLVFTRIYLADPADYQGLNDVYRKFVSAVPPARATINPRLSDSQYLLELQSVAVRGSGQGRPSGAGFTSPIHSFSVKAGSRLYITGMTGRPTDGSAAKRDIQSQTRQSLKIIEEQLRKNGMTFADVVDSTVWLRDARDFTGMNEVYAEIVRPDPPARTTVRVPPNSGDTLVEIMMVAVK